MKNFLSKSGAAGPYLLLFGAVLAVYGGLLAGDIVICSDSLSYQFPEKSLIPASLSKGIFPFINPFILCGAPLLGNMDAGSLYPLNILLSAGTLSWGYGLFIFIHYVLAAFAMYLLLSKGFGAGMQASAAGAVAYSCGGYLWSMSGNGFYRCGWLIPLFFLGLILLLEDNADAKERRRASLLAVFSLAMLFYCGNFLETYMAVAFGGIYAFTAMCGTSRFQFGKLLLPSETVVLALLLAAPQLLPSIMLSMDSYRQGGIPLTEAQQWSFPAARLVEYLVPNFFGLRNDFGLWCQGIYRPEETFSKTGLDPWADSVFIGIPLILSAALFFTAKLGTKKFLAAAVLISFLLALGKLTPLYGVLHHLLPGFSMFRHPEKILFWVNFWLIISGSVFLGSFCSSDSSGPSRRKLSKAALCLCIFLAAASAAIFAVFLVSPKKFTLFFQSSGTLWDGERIFLWLELMLGLSLAAAAGTFLVSRSSRLSGKTAVWLLALVTFMQMLVLSGLSHWKIPWSSVQKTPTWDSRLPDFDRHQWRIFSSENFRFPVKSAEELNDRYLEQKLSECSSLKYNSPALKGLMTPAGFSPAMDRKYIGYMNFERHPAEYVLDLLSIRYIAVPPIPDSMVPEGSRISLRDEAFTILENTDALPRIGAYGGIASGTGADVFTKEHVAGGKPFIPVKPSNYKETVKIADSPKAHLVEELPGKIVLSTTGPAWVVVRDWKIPGWRCMAEEGGELEIVEADGGLMAVFADSPNMTLIFEYRPPGLRVGLILLAAGLLILTVRMNFRP